MTCYSTYNCFSSRYLMFTWSFMIWLSETAEVRRLSNMFNTCFTHTTPDPSVQIRAACITELLFSLTFSSFHLYFWLFPYHCRKVYRTSMADFVFLNQSIHLYSSWIDAISPRNVLLIKFSFSQSILKDKSGHLLYKLY